MIWRHFLCFLHAVRLVVVFQEFAGNQVGDLAVVGLKEVPQLQHAISVPCPVVLFFFGGKRAEEGGGVWCGGVWRGRVGLCFGTAQQKNKKRNELMNAKSTSKKKNTHTQAHTLTSISRTHREGKHTHTTCALTDGF